MDELERLHADLGWKRLRPGWAKAEIVLGLAAVAVGIMSMADPPAWWADLERLRRACSLALVVLGGYLALAGHRSHLYQSSNRLAAWLATRFRDEPRAP